MAGTTKYFFEYRTKDLQPRSDVRNLTSMAAARRHAYTIRDKEVTSVEIYRYDEKTDEHKLVGTV